MVLTKPELIGSLQHEVNILLHLASKVDRTKVDYRPTPKQRSTLELLQYLSMMGPELIKVAKAGKFDPPAWSAAENAVKSRISPRHPMAPPKRSARRARRSGALRRWWSS